MTNRYKQMLNQICIAISDCKIGLIDDLTSKRITREELDKAYAETNDVIYLISEKLLKDKKKWTNSTY